MLRRDRQGREYVLTPLPGPEVWARIDDYTPGRAPIETGPPCTWEPGQDPDVEFTLVDADGNEVDRNLTLAQTYRVAQAIYDEKGEP